MCVRTLLRLAAMVTVLGLTALSLPAQDQNTDDVAAAARKAREQQKNAPKPKKVVTNDDIPSVNTSAPATDSSAAKAEGQTEGQADAKATQKDDENDPKSEAYWRKRFQQVRDKLAQSEKELDVLQRELDKNQVQYYSDPQQAMTQQYNRSDINDKTAQIDAKKKEIEGLKQQLSDMEDDLRKSGGDPGWAR